jgi:putative redox protein
MSTETHVTVSETGEGLYTQEIRAGNHVYAADEPSNLGGLDKGPAPYDFLLSALGACTVMTLRMYAAQKKWDVRKVSVFLTHRKEEQAGKRVDIITREISLEGTLDDTQRQRLLEIANKCPVHRTLETPPHILSTLV